MKKILISGVMLALIAPQVAMASWWNPFSWSIFNRPAEVRVEQTHDVNFENKKATSTATSTVKIPQQKEVVAKDKKDVISLPKKQAVEMPPKPVEPTPQAVQKQEYKISNSDLEVALDKIRGQLILDFVKTSAPHLANMAGLVEAQFDILQNGRDRCAKDYDKEIEDTRQRYEYVLGANEKHIKDLMVDKENCMSTYPQVDPSFPPRIDQAVSQLDVLYRKAHTNSLSTSEINAILQEYDSIEAQIYLFNESIPSFTFRASLPIRSKEPPSSSSSSCTFSPTGNGYSCRSGSGVNTNCSISPSGSSFNCSSSNGENINCSLSPSGNGVSCY